MIHVESLAGKPVFVAYPAGFDFTFVYGHRVHFAGKIPFAHRALDLRIYAMALLRREFHASSTRAMPGRGFSERPHAHVALDDAIEQGELFCRMLAENLASAE